MTYYARESGHRLDHRPYHSSNLRYISHAYPISSNSSSEGLRAGSLRFPSLSCNQDARLHTQGHASIHTYDDVHAHEHNHGYDPSRSAPPSLPPPRASSLHSRHTTISNDHPLPPLPATPISPTLTRSKRKAKSDRSVTIHTSPISSLTTSQFQHNIFPILQTIASQMYRARMWNEAHRLDGEGDVLSVKSPTMGQVLRQAEKVGWNLRWEGWSW